MTKNVQTVFGNDKYVGNKESLASFDFVEPTTKTTICISKLSFVRGKIFILKNKHVSFKEAHLQFSSVQSHSCV